MKKRYVITCLFFINFYPVFPQTVDISIIVSDGIFTQTNLRVGLDSTATVGIDPHLGELRITFLPAAGIFETRFDLTDSVGSWITTYRDYRHAVAFPFSGSKEHILIWQLGDGGTAFTISYNFPQGVSAVIMDAFGGIYFNQILSNSGSCTITYPLNRAKLIMNYNNVIPVELISFTAAQSGSAVKLEWMTSSETNNQGFQIERRKTQDERNEEWKNIGFVNGNGTTTEIQSYSFVDKNLEAGRYQYRLKQIDFDGTFEYSNVIEVEINAPAKFSLEQNYPNPFNPVTSIEYRVPSTEKVVLKVFDILGREVATLVNEEKPAGSYEVKFSATGGPESSIQNPASGVYFYQLKAGDFIAANKMVLLR